MEYSEYCAKYFQIFSLTHTQTLNTDLSFTDPLSAEELPQDPNGQSQSVKSLTGSGFSEHLHMANGGCKQVQKTNLDAITLENHLLHGI